VSLDWHEADGINLGVGDKVTEIQTDRYRATAYNVIARRRAVRIYLSLRPIKSSLGFVTGLDLASSNLSSKIISLLSNGSYAHPHRLCQRSRAYKHSLDYCYVWHFHIFLLLH